MAIVSLEQIVAKKKAGELEARPLLVLVRLVSAIEDVIADRGDPPHVPARSDITRVEEERVTNCRLLQSLVGDLRDCDSRLPLAVETNENCPRWNSTPQYVPGNRPPLWARFAITLPTAS